MASVKEALETITKQVGSFSLWQRKLKYVFGHTSDLIARTMKREDGRITKHFIHFVHRPPTNDELRDLQDHATNLHRQHRPTDVLDAFDGALSFVVQSAVEKMAPRVEDVDPELAVSAVKNYHSIKRQLPNGNTSVTIRVNPVESWTQLLDKNGTVLRAVKHPNSDPIIGFVREKNNK